MVLQYFSVTFDAERRPTHLAAEPVKRLRHSSIFPSDANNAELSAGRLGVFRRHHTVSDRICGSGLKPAISAPVAVRQAEPPVAFAGTVKCLVRASRQMRANFGRSGSLGIAAAISSAN
jgi:hypothetical protein